MKALRTIEGEVINLDEYILSKIPQIETKPSITEADYIIYKEGGTVKALNGKTGEIDYQDTDATTVIQNAINALTNGGKIYITRGTYLITETIYINNDFITIEGAGMGTILKLNSNISPMISSKQNGALSNNISIKNMKMDGDKTNRTVGTGIEGFFFASRFESLNILNFVNDGIYLKFSSGTVDNWVLRCRISSCDGKGLNLLATDGLYMQNVILNCGNGIYDAGENNIIAHNYIYGSNGPAINIFKSINRDNVYIHGNNIWVPGGKSAIKLAVSSGYKIFNIDIINNKIYTDGYGLYIDITEYENLNVIGNTFINKGLATAVFYIAGGVTINNLIFKDNVIRGITTFIDGPGGTIINKYIKDNIGYPTENSGIATFSSDGTFTVQFRIPHGLVSTPSKYGVSPLTPDAQQVPYTVTVDATYITITYTSVPPAGTNNIKFGWWAEV